MLEIGIIESVRRSYSFWGEVKTPGSEDGSGITRIFLEFFNDPHIEKRDRGMYSFVDFIQV